MAYLFPRFAYAPVRCAPARHELGSLFSLFDDTARELAQFQRVARHSRKTFNPRFDVKEEKEFYVLEGEVPGFQESDLSIEWNDDTLAVSGHHETVTESSKQPEAVESTPQTTAAEQDTNSETSSVKSHQATVEDEVDEQATPASSTAAVTKAAAPEAPTPAQPAQADVQHLISERRTGQFLRQFRFPSNAVDHEAIKASLQSGILKIVVPKAEAPVSRRINID